MAGVTHMGTEPTPKLGDCICYGRFSALGVTSKDRRLELAWECSIRRQNTENVCRYYKPRPRPARTSDGTVFPEGLPDVGPYMPEGLEISQYRGYYQSIIQ